MFATKGDLSRTLMSLFPPAKPKNACHIQVDWSAMASRMTLRMPSLSWNWPCRALGHFSHVQCIQSRLPNIPRKPRAVLMSICFLKFASVGCCKYVSPKQAQMAFTQRLMPTRAVVSPMQMYSSQASARSPYASIRTAAVHFCKLNNPNLPRASRFCTNQGSYAHTELTRCRKSSLLIQNRRRNCTAS